MLARNVPKKSSFSVQNCVVVTVEDNGDVVLRHSNSGDEAVRYTAEAYTEFIQGVKADEFDYPTD